MQPGRGSIFFRKYPSQDTWGVGFPFANTLYIVYVYVHIYIYIYIYIYISSSCFAHSDHFARTYIDHPCRPTAVAEVIERELDRVKGLIVQQLLESLGKFSEVVLHSLCPISTPSCVSLLHQLASFEFLSVIKSLNILLSDKMQAIVQ